MPKFKKDFSLFEKARSLYIGKYKGIKNLTKQKH